jgi:hypothetical protein
VGSSLKAAAKADGGAHGSVPDGEVVDNTQLDIALPRGIPLSLKLAAILRGQDEEI